MLTQLKHHLQVGKVLIYVIRCPVIRKSYAFLYIFVKTSSSYCLYFSNYWFLFLLWILDHSVYFFLPWENMHCCLYEYRNVVRNCHFFLFSLQDRPITFALSAPTKCIVWVISGSLAMAAKWRSVGAPNFRMARLGFSVRVNVHPCLRMPTYPLPDVPIQSWSSRTDLASVPTFPATKPLQDVSITFFVILFMFRFYICI